MRNPNTKPVLTLDEKRAPCYLPGKFYHPMVVQSYNASANTYTLSNDIRYLCDPEVDGANCNTEFYNLDDIDVPCPLIYAVIGDEMQFSLPEDLIGYMFLIPGESVDV